MKITFLGVGGAYADENYQSNMLMEVNGKKILFDCGTDIRFSLKEKFKDINNGNISDYIDAVYVSHIHQDHSGGLEWLGFCTYFNPKAPKPTLICSNELKDELWSDFLKGCKDINLQTYFDVKSGESFKVGDVSFKLVKRTHVKSNPEKFSYGLLIQNKDSKKMYITSDVCFESDVPEYQEADIIFQDCETHPFKSNVHSHYDDLKTLPPDVKKKMYLYHYKDGSDKEINCQEDGFAGFVKKGSSFTL
jgi:flavorubredoxin